MAQVSARELRLVLGGGRWREVLLGKPTNYLLMKDDVGRAKPSTRNLPNDHFSYGKGNKNNQEPASIVTTSWETHKGGALTNDRNPKNF